MTTFNLSKDFQKALKALATANDWDIEFSGKTTASIEFASEAGEGIPLYVDRYEEQVVFTVSAAPIFKDEKDIPHDASTYLLRRNADLPFGFWCLEESDEGEMFYSLVHAEPLGEMDTEHFADIVDVLMDECEEFDKQWGAAGGETKEEA
jgi:hypothetical protein